MLNNLFYVFVATIISCSSNASELTFDERGIVDDSLAKSVHNYSLNSTKDVISTIANYQDLRNLETISLRSNNLTSSGANSILCCISDMRLKGMLPNLSRIDLSFNRISQRDNEFYSFEKTIVSMLSKDNCPEIHVNGNYFQPYNMIREIIGQDPEIAQVAFQKLRY